ncbi:carnitine dehydratase [bacterium]|nr:carnitine dehydratase [bacterium]
MDRTSLPLSGITVVDFGQYIAGPAVAMILGDLGATVVHVDPPGGPMWDSPANAVLMRNKLCVTLDLKTAEGLAQARALIAEADILVENFRPGVMARLGLDPAELRKARPDLITVSIPGFASDDALRREWRAFEGVIAAASGVFTDMGLNRVLMGKNPCYSPLPLASAYGTMLAASACVLALQAREMTGLGDRIEVPLASALLEGLTYNSLLIEDYPLRYQTQREREIERRRAEGLPMDVSYAALQDFLDPFYRSYLCRDGRMFYVVCPSHRHHAKRCLQTLGIYDDLVAEGLREEPDTYLPASEWTSDVSLGVYPLPKAWADKISARMKAVFLTRTAKEWERVFGKGRFPGAPQRWLSEWISDDHAETAGLMIEVDDPVLGRMIQPGPMAWLAESGEAMLRPAPRRAVEAAEALTALKAVHVSRAQVEGPARGWLDGVRVLDLCNVIAGPHSVAYLARFGAEVIKLDPATPLYDCWNTVIFGMTHMRGKRSILLDITAGREVFEALVKSVDVVVWNATDRQVAALGLDSAALQALNPKAIFCQLDCFGGVRPGPRSDYLGYDDLVQAATGIMLRFGGAMQTPEEHAHVGTIDVMCGFGAALGVGAALFQKYRTGRIGRPRTSLSALSGLAQIPFCHDYIGRAPFDEAAGPDAMGSDALNHLYRTADRWIMLAARAADLPRFARVAGLEAVQAAPVDAREAVLARAFAGASAAEWQRRLLQADIGMAICGSLEEIRAATVSAAEAPRHAGSYAFTRFDDHPSGHVVTQLDPNAVRPDLGRVYRLPSAEKYGTSTRAVLHGLGYGAAEIDALIRQGILSESWSRQYLPD